MRRLLLVVNPSASGFTGSMLRDVRGELAESFEVETVWPEGPDESREAAADAAKEGFEVVAAVPARLQRPWVTPSRKRSPLPR
jgi:diacylglycerol kinase family enzyme